MSDPIEVGAVFEVEHPFVRGTYTEWDEDGAAEVSTWNPGVRGEFVPPDGGEEVADGVGKQILTVVEVFKPGRFPRRIFYTRQWVRPDGRKFGKAGKLHIKTEQAFRRLIRGYRHEYRIADPATVGDT